MQGERGIPMGPTDNDELVEKHWCDEEYEEIVFDRELMARYYNLSNLSHKMVDYLCEVGMLRGNLSEDWSLLAKLNSLIYKQQFLKLALAHLPKKDRQRLVDTANYNKWEAYAYSRTYNAIKPPRMSQLVAEIETLYGFKMKYLARKRVQLIRKRAINKRNYEKKAGKDG
jgi:hypothetical protein